MNAAGDLLDHLARIGATVKPAGDRLILRAGLTAIPATLANRVREAKADLIATLALRTVRNVPEEQEDAGEPTRHQSERRTFEGCIVEWLNQHPTPSAPGRCAWCGMPESPGAVVLPFGTEPGTHVWFTRNAGPLGRRPGRQALSPRWRLLASWRLLVMFRRGFKTEKRSDLNVDRLPTAKRNSCS